MKIPFKNIAISGDTGTGKSTLAKNLAEELGWRQISAGEFFRKWHEEHGIPLEKTGEVPPEVDKAIDFGFQEQMQNSRHVIFESRLAGYLAKDLPDVFKILCTADFKETMERVAKREGITVDEARSKGKERSKALEEKFGRLYGVSDYLNPKYFNLVVDSTNLSSEETLDLVIDKVNTWLLG